ncbi:MAG TPA: NnrU family protein [Gammaproteobacteria bacterium]|nr:NnrU family protein [Gammaproteobacteria bacterium]
MPLFIAGLVLFFGVHSVSIVAEPWRNRMVARIGEMRWQGLYSLVAVVGFALIVLGYDGARHASPVLYRPPLWTHYITLVLLLPVFPLLIAAYLPGRIQAATRHPMLLAVMFWAAGHLVATGTVIDVVLFAVFLAWAVVDRISVGLRPLREIRHLPAGRMNDAVIVVVGLAMYAAFLGWAHSFFIGVSPLTGLG